MNTKGNESVKIRERKLLSGNISLYLDIYRNGKREYEFLKLYLIPETNRSDKEKNRETLRLAEAIRSKRNLELINHEYGFKKNFATDTLFFEYYNKMCQDRFGPKTKSNWENWMSALQHLQNYEPRKDITFADIDRDWVQGFKEYLSKIISTRALSCHKKENVGHLSVNSQLSYFNKLRAVLKQACEERIIPYNPCHGVEPIKAVDGMRMYLTIEELQKIANVESDHPGVKRAFLFSCLTGLRRSDILALRWGDVYKEGEFDRIVFRQQKTDGQEYLDITPQARELMGERGADNEKVFFDLPCPDTTNDEVRNMAAKAGINKYLTFHCGRHTFATLMLDLGTDIYTVSKLLGHKHVTTTQIYAKVMDKNKQEAVKKIPTLKL